jgi:hypothetical protein
MLKILPGGAPFAFESPNFIPERTPTSCSVCLSMYLVLVKSPTRAHLHLSDHIPHVLQFTSWLNKLSSLFLCFYRFSFLLILPWLQLILCKIMREKKNSDLAQILWRCSSNFYSARWQAAPSVALLKGHLDYHRSLFFFLFFFFFFIGFEIQQRNPFMNSLAYH